MRELKVQSQFPSALLCFNTKLGFGEDENLLYTLHMFQFVFFTSPLGAAKYQVPV